jgi:ABC-type glycerol-3-phosphate transport system substrate-binding protein
MKTPRPRLLTPHRLTIIAVTSVAALLSPFTSHAKDHVDVTFWDMIWGGPEYMDAGKALVAQFNQETPDITVTYRTIPWTNWYQTFVTAIAANGGPLLKSDDDLGFYPLKYQHRFQYRPPWPQIENVTSPLAGKK